jgi:hypothetical protein
MPYKLRRIPFSDVHMFRTKTSSAFILFPLTPNEISADPKATRYSPIARYEQLIDTTVSGHQAPRPSIHAASLTARVQAVFQNTDRPRGQRLGQHHSPNSSTSRRYQNPSRQQVTTANSISGKQAHGRGRFHSVKAAEFSFHHRPRIRATPPLADRS